MKYELLGRTGLSVSRFCLGANTFGDEGDAGREALGALDQKAATDIVSRAIDAGINFFDAANVHGTGESEEMLGRSLKDIGIPRSDAIVATKGRMPTVTDSDDIKVFRARLMSAVDASLRRLGTEYLDIFTVDRWDQSMPVEETIRALDDLVHAKKVRYLGCSNFAAWQAMLCLGIAECEALARFELAQAYYSIAVRDLEREQASMLLHQKVGLTVGGALAGGLLTGKYKRGKSSPEGSRFSGGFWIPFDEVRTFRVIDVLKAIARERGITAAQVAIAWLLHQPVVSSVILGVRNLAQLDENIGAVDVALTADELEILDEVSELPCEYPGWKVADAYRDRFAS